MEIQARKKRNESVRSDLLKKSSSKSKRNPLQEGSEFVLEMLSKRQEAEVEVSELKMLKFSLGVTKMDTINNKHIRLTAEVSRFGGQNEMVWTCTEEGQ